jgi:hypothetical protein
MNKLTKPFHDFAISVAEAFKNRVDVITIISFGIELTETDKNEIRRLTGCDKVFVSTIECEFDLNMPLRPQVEKVIRIAKRSIEPDDFIVILPPALPAAAYWVGAAFSLCIEQGVPEPNRIVWKKPSGPKGKASKVSYSIGGIE